MVSIFSDKENLGELKNYLSDKNGYDHNDSEKFEEGIELAASWSLISKKFHNADLFLCQSTRAKDKTKLEDCYKNKDDVEDFIY